jgi:hypothetical protein
VNVVLVDDIDGSDAAETVSFAMDGIDYEIDLSEKHAADLRDAVSLYVGHARRIGGRRKGNRRSGSGAGGSGGSGGAAGSGGSGGSGASAADIRAWARENGYEVPERGRVSAEVREAYAAAN